MSARANVVLTACVAVLIWAPTAGAATIRVETDVDEFGPGGSAACTLREAVEAARRNRAFGGCRRGSRKRRDTVVLLGDAHLQIDGFDAGNSAGDLDVDKGGKLTIRGASGPSPDPPAIVQDGSDRILEVRRVRGVTIQGIDMHGGDLVAAGGAVRVAAGAAVTLSDVHLHDNEAAERGGAVACEGCRSLRFAGAFNIDQNEVFAPAGVIGPGGGAVWADGPLSLLGEHGVGGLPFTNAQITGNRIVPAASSRGHGGAIFASADVTIRDAYIATNDVFGSGDGGAIETIVPAGGDLTLTLDRVTIAGNQAEGSGGGIAMSRATESVADSSLALVMRRSAVTGNEANGAPSGNAFGGGLRIRGNATITDSAIAGNVAQTQAPGLARGGAIWAAPQGVPTQPSRLDLTRVSVTDNTVGTGAGPSGGGIYADVALRAVNTTISENSVPAAAGQGGGLYLSDSWDIASARFDFSTLADNIAGEPSGGDGIFSGLDDRPRIRASIIEHGGDGCSGNFFGADPADILSAGYNVEAPADPDCGIDAPTDTHSNPILAALNANGSPPVGFGDPPPFGGQLIPPTNAFTNNSSAALDIVPPGQCKVAGVRLATDARGAPRPAEEGCDAGAIERTACLGLFVAGPGGAIGTAGDDQINNSALGVVVAQGGDDFISTYGGADRVCAGSGDDEILPGNGAGEADQISGGAGRDRLNYNNAGNGTFNLAAGTANGFPFGADTFTSIEDIQASEGEDTVLGSSGRNRLIGGGDPDTIEGRGGIDVIDARDGEPDVEIDCGAGKNKKEKALIDPGLDPTPKSC